MSPRSHRVIGSGLSTAFSNSIHWLGGWKWVLPAVGGLLLTPSNVQAQYAFTNIADTTTAAPSGDFTRFDSPGISEGVAAFQGFYNGGSGIFTGSGGGLTPIVEQGAAATPLSGTFDYLTDPSISGGTVAFGGSSTAGGAGIFSSNGGALTTIAKTGDSDPAGGTFTSDLYGPSISGGTVAFLGANGSGTGVFTGSGGAITTIVTTGAAAPTGTFTSIDSSITSISGGMATFIAGYGAGGGVFAGNGGALTAIAETGDAAPIGTFGDFNLLSSISGGTVVFGAQYNSNTEFGSGIFTGSGGALTSIVQAGQAAPTGTFTSGFDNPSINNGEVAFSDYYDDFFQQGLFTDIGGALTPVLETGDSLFGSTITSLDIGASGLDERGDIAFSYSLSNGVSGVAIATVPEPASISLLSISGLSLLARRRRRQNESAGLEN